jgi:UPF0755 protein
MKKIILLILILLAIGVFSYGYTKLKQRQARLAYQEAVKNSKAPEVKITFIEGWNNKDIAEYLEKSGIIKSEDFLKQQKNFNISNYSKLNQKPSNLDLEGYIFPDTYFIPKNVPSGTLISNIILKKALDNFSQKITPEILEKAKNNGLNLHQLITLASIVEKESGKNLKERQLIAGVFYNRLKIGMPLQSDTTVNFVTGKSKAQSTLEDTKIDSPYNTYKYAGLPPGPICSPGLEAILATVEPAKTDYLYFLHDQKNGQVYFGKTLDEHNLNKAKYLK